MTATVLYTVRCDGEACAASISAETAWEARDIARSQGWTCGKKMAGRDLCPEHTS